MASSIKKRQANGRCYNQVDGKGWNHYTKGYRTHKTTAETLSNGFTKLFDFLVRPFPKKEESK